MTATSPTSTHQTAQDALSRVVARAWRESLDDAAGDATTATTRFLSRIKHDRRLASALVQLEILALAGPVLDGEGVRVVVDGGAVRWITQ